MRYIRIGHVGLFHSRTHHCAAAALFFVAAFDVYGASTSGTEVLQADMRCQLLRDGAIVCSHWSRFLLATGLARAVPSRSF